MLNLKNLNLPLNGGVGASDDLLMEMQEQKENTKALEFYMPIKIQHNNTKYL